MTGSTGVFTKQLQKFAPGLDMSWQLFAEYVASLAGGDTQQVVAHAGGGQGSATQLMIGFTEITAVATVGDSIKLPSAAINKAVILKNDGVNYADVFPFSGDTINDGSANAAIRIYPGQTIGFYGINTINWETNSQAGGPEAVSVTTNITAFAGGGQTSATQLVSGYNLVKITATAGDSVKILPAIVGIRQTVRNNGASVLAIFPSSGNTINSLAADASISLLPGFSLTFVATSTSAFYTENPDGTMLPSAYPSVAQNNITAGTGGAISVANYLTTINTDAGGDAFTLADGTVRGQMKKILLVVDGGGDGVVTPATALSSGATTITFNDTTDYVILQWNGASWIVIENFGTVIA